MFINFKNKLRDILGSPILEVHETLGWWVRSGLDGSLNLTRPPTAPPPLCLGLCRPQLFLQI